MSNEQTGQVEDEDKTKEERMVDFAKAMTVIDESIQPFKEHKASLKELYKTEGWLTKEEMTLTTKAMRMLKNDETIEDIAEVFEVIKRSQRR